MRGKLDMMNVERGMEDGAMKMAEEINFRDACTGYKF